MLCNKITTFQEYGQKIWLGFVPQTVSLWKVQVVWAGHYPFLSWNSCLQDYGHCMVMMHVRAGSPVATSPSMKMMEKKEYQLKVREHSRNMQMLSSRQASTKRLQEIRPRNAILIVVTPSLWRSFRSFSDFSTFHNRALLYRIIRTALASTLCTCLTFRPQPTLGWILRLRCADLSVHEPEKTRYR